MLTRERKQTQAKVLTRRAALMAGGQIGLFGALIGRLYYLQVVEGPRYEVMAESNRINLRLLAPRRGRILDRFGIPLAINEQNYQLVLVPEQAGDIPSTLEAIATLVPLGETDRRRVLRDVGRKHGFVPLLIRENLTWEEMSRIEVNAPELPGISIELGLARRYPFGDRVSHVLGYVAPPSEAELQEDPDPLLELPDFRIGKEGIEKTADDTLRGSAGNAQIEVNALGRVVREVNRDDGVPGEDVVVSLDMALQDFARRRIAGEESATCVVLDAVTGQVLVMASTPSYDPNAFTHGLPSTLWHELIADPHGPLTNKAVQGHYPPGSTFKPCVALAALHTGTITPDFRVTCTGETRLGDAVFHCWWKAGHGTLDLHGAIKNSCDMYFYELAHRLGVDRIADMAHRLGFGAPVGIDLPSENAGLIPTRAWKRAKYGVPWQDGETYSIGIGQGYVAATPLQLATMVARLVTNREIIPQVIRDDGVVEASTPVEKDGGFDSLGLDPRHLAAVLSGMDAVTNELGGTAYGARITDPGMEMGGKSGTSQVRHITMAEREHGLRKPDQIPWKERDHALFIAFAPVSSPRYVCAVVVEHGIGGSKYAAPIARDVLRECQRRDPGRRLPPDPPITPDVKPIEPVQGQSQAASIDEGPME